ncbi:MAG: hypothetical protein QXJ75_04270 [Candidatus Bathyarchaeia archaeon]
MGEEDVTYARKVKRAAQLLLFQRHRKPGMKGWELKKNLGRDYMKIIELLNLQLERLGLRVKTVYEEPSTPASPSDEQLERARFFVTLDEPMTTGDMSSSGLRIDDIAVLSVAIAYIISKQGKALRREVKELLTDKIPEWRVDLNLDRFIKRGYLFEDEEGLLHLDWRTRAEVDLNALTELMLAKQPPARKKEDVGDITA